jgi:hypothetical protein
MPEEAGKYREANAVIVSPNDDAHQQRKKAIAKSAFIKPLLKWPSA